MHPEDVSAAVGQKWEIEISKDVRIPALVSLIKAAHLTFFEMLGYRFQKNRNTFPEEGKSFPINKNSYLPPNRRRSDCCSL
jgi:hypothetical protein